MGTDQTNECKADKMGGFKVLPKGSPKALGDILVDGISVFRGVNRIATANLLLLDGDASAQEFKASQLPELRPGKELTIQLGPVGEEETIFTGIIIKHGVRTRKVGGPVLFLELRHEAIKMTHIRRSQRFPDDQTDEDLIGKLIKDAGLSPDVTLPKSVEHKELIQYNTTDWDFVVTRAEANGAFVFTNEDKVTVKRPEIDPGPVTGLKSFSFGGAILDLEVETDARHQYSDVKAQAWNYFDDALSESRPVQLPKLQENSKNVPSDEMAGIFGEGVYQLFHSGFHMPEELQNWADAKLQKSRLAKVTGRVKIKGRQSILPGDTIVLDKISDILNGKVFVSSIRHFYSNGIWITDMELGTSPEWFMLEKNVNDIPLSGLMPQIPGLQVGIVRQIHDDPKEAARVRVSLPIVGADSDGIWARVLSPDAGNGRGLFFRPELDEEVIVGFLNGDPRDPIVLGSVFGGKDRIPPFDATEENEKKGFVSKSGLALVFDDEEESILIKTEEGNSILITNEKDGGEITIKNQDDKNEIIMGPDGISVKSAGDISFEASGNISFKTKDLGNIEADADGDLSLTAGLAGSIKSSTTLGLESGLIELN